jgi:hypothetical protein
VWGPAALSGFPYCLAAIKADGGIEISALLVTSERQLEKKGKALFSAPDSLYYN